MSSESGSAPEPTPAGAAGQPPQAGGGVERKPAGAKGAARSGHAVEPPPTIRPKSRPSPTVAPATPVKRVGHSEGESGPSHPKSGPSVTGSKRSYRTTRSMVVQEAGAKKPPHAPGPPAATARTSVRPPTGPVPAGAPRGPRPAGGPAASPLQAPPSGPVPAAARPAPSAGPVDQAALTQVVAAAAGIEATGQVVAATSAKGRKRVKLNLSYIAPLSVMKIAFLVSVAMGIAFVVAVYIFWTVLNDRQIFTQINQMITDLVGQNRPESLEILKYVEPSRVMSGAAIIAIIDVIVFTVISTLLAVIYNIIAALVGGVRVTLKEH
ncbi:MAG: DUF3566 domain-containing protein [Bifidobacteriaceae bacterium]|jgi:hypothetical protein|nr:DUF3566 domain-containing protein [Bifidobacteriaceae bacterium]